MNSDSFEKAYSDFLERKEYDEAEKSLFGIVRVAFAAGWLAALGESLQQPRNLFEIFRRDTEDNSKDK